MLRNMLPGHRLAEICYKPALGETTIKEGDKFAKDHVVEGLKDSQYFLQKLTLDSTRPSILPKLSHFNKLDFLEMPFQPGFLECDQRETASLLCKHS